jgi:hypothetical protein
MSKGILSFSSGKFRVLVDGMPISIDGTKAYALRAAQSMRVTVQPEAWNGDRGEWVHINTLEE